MLTIIGVMFAEIVIFVPSVARFRVDYLQERLERSQIASLALLATQSGRIDSTLATELLNNADVLNIVLIRDQSRQLVLTSPMPAPIDHMIDLRSMTPVALMRDALDTLVNQEDRVIRIMGEPVKGAGLLIDITLEEAPLKAAMIDYGFNILRLSLIISITTAIVLFFAVRWLMVAPIKRLIGQIQYFQESPQDQSRIIEPRERVKELRLAENALQSMETDLSQSLRQKERLAALGSAVSKISHDLRNMLTTATLLADTMERSDDPRVKRSAPKLVGAISRAVNLCERTLTFGRAEEAEPEHKEFSMLPFLEDVAENERLSTDPDKVQIKVVSEPTATIQADEDQMFRVVSNLIRNARQVLEIRKEPGLITVTAGETDTNWEITIADNGPGLPPKALEKLFTPFEGGVRRGGSGLGLAISAELVAGHGGVLELQDSSGDGATFVVRLPKPKSV